jgi:site-specific DNA-adenine methylase
MDDAEDAIIDVENQIQELENIWRDTFIEFEERVLDAIVKMYQTVIDNYSELNDTLNETNTNILDSINKEISLQRQIRDNTKTEQEIADNEAQLAYLQRDTTGGNALDILQRGKDLDE